MRATHKFNHSCHQEKDHMDLAFAGVSSKRYSISMLCVVQIRIKLD